MTHDETRVPVCPFIDAANRHALARLVTLTDMQKGTLLCEIGSIFTTDWTKAEILFAKFTMIRAMHDRFSHRDTGLMIRIERNPP
ncbi:MAG: hypothetical protein WC736_14655 [Gallionella sp.]|jgi:hypothetical protein